MLSDLFIDRFINYRLQMTRRQQALASKLARKLKKGAKKC